MRLLVRGPHVLPEPTVLSPEPTLLLSRARPLGARSSTPLTLIPSLSSAPLTLNPRSAHASWPAETGVRLRRTWRVTGNMGLTYEV